MGCDDCELIFSGSLGHPVPPSIVNLDQFPELVSLGLYSIDMFSRTCEYAIKVMIYLSANQRGEQAVGLEQIAANLGTPKPFTAKVLQQLVRAGLLTSTRGKNGGFRLVREEVSLGEIVNAIDGDRLLKACVLGFDECSEKNPCPVHSRFVEARRQLEQTLQRTTLDEFAILDPEYKWYRVE